MKKPLLAALLGLTTAALPPAAPRAQSGPVPDEPGLEVERPADPEHAEAPSEDEEEGEAFVDPRLRSVLEAEGLEYTVGRSGDLQVLIRFDEDGRSQYVRLQSSTRRYRNIEFRDVYSTAYRFDPQAGPGTELLHRLLEANNTYTLGFWAVQDDVIFNIARIPAQASPAMVREAISFVAAEADELEKELLGSDDY